MKMNRLAFAALFLFFFISGVYAQCNSTQININTANAGGLDNLAGIGPAKAQAIIDSREIQLFGSVDDLINVSGIGPVTLDEIKQQGLACVDITAASGEENSGNQSSANTSSEIQSLSTQEPSINSQANPNFKPVESITPTTEAAIDLNENAQNANSKDIKKGNSVIDLSKLPIYGLVAFSVLIGVLFFMKNRRGKKYKTEFN